MKPVATSPCLPWWSSGGRGGGGFCSRGVEQGRGPLSGHWFEDFLITSCIFALSSPPSTFVSLILCHSCSLSLILACPGQRVPRLTLCLLQNCFAISVTLNNFLHLPLWSSRDLGSCGLTPFCLNALKMLCACWALCGTSRAVGPGASLGPDGAMCPSKGTPSHGHHMPQSLQGDRLLPRFRAVQAAPPFSHCKHQQVLFILCSCAQLWSHPQGKGRDGSVEG